jgi:hypothetical protein
MLLIEPLDFTGRMHVAVSMVRQSARPNLSESVKNIRLSKLCCLGAQRGGELWSVVPVTPGQGHSATAVRTLHQQRLVEIQLARLEIICGAGEIQPPDSGFELAD